MAGISSMGIGSGIDVNSLVQQLVSAERAPQANRLSQKESSLESRLSAYGSLKSALSKFQGSVQDLTDIDAFRAISATSSDEDVVSVSASPGAQTGRFDIQVSQLAQSQSIASQGFSSKTDAVGTGKLVFKFGSVGADDGSVFTQNEEASTKTVEIGAGNNTLQGIRDAVNEAEIGVRASIINDGSGERLIFTSEKSGAGNGFVIEAQDGAGAPAAADGLGRLAFGPEAGGSGMSRTRAGEDALLTVNGLEISRASNEFSDVLDGVKIQLKGTNEAPLSVDVSRDMDAVKGKITGFVDAYNAFQTQVRQLSSYNAETQQASVLTGDALLRNVSDTLRRAMTSTVEVLDDGAIRAFSDLGIMTKRDGTLEVDSGKLDDALEENFELVGALFASTGLPSDDTVEYVSGRGVTEAGNYDIKIDQMAERGRLEGSPVSSFGLSQAVDFRIEVDGERSGTITLAPNAAYTAEELALELQSKINGDKKLSDEGKSVSVEYADGRFVVRSASYGSESTVEITSADDAFTTLTGLSGEGEPGKDVQGSIGGHKATGEGQHLIGAEGTPVEGLKLLINGDATGDRGTVTFSRGLMSVLNDRLSAFLDSDGVFDSTTKGIKDQLDRLEDEWGRLDRRMEKVEARLVAQFTAMDTLVAQLNNTGQFLSNQLAGLQINKPGGS